MALKDWKKRRYGIEWDTKDSLKNIRVRRQGGTNLWLVVIGFYEREGKSSFNTLMREDVQSFKTKPHALKYAKLYMRTH